MITIEGLEHRYASCSSLALTKQSIKAKRSSRHYNLKMAKLNLTQNDINTAILFCTLAEKDQQAIDEIERFYPNL